MVPPTALEDPNVKQKKHSVIYPFLRWSYHYIIIDPLVIIYLKKYICMPSFFLNMKTMFLFMELLDGSDGREV